MSLFTEHSGGLGPAGDRPTGGRRRSPVGWIILGIALIIIIVLGATPAPYVIDKPGPVFNTLGTSEHDGKEVPLITVPEDKSHPTSGALDLLTVSQIGSPEQRPDWFQVAMAWFDPSRAVVPIDIAFPPNVSSDEVSEQNEALMIDSQQDAIAAALIEQGYDFPREVTVASVAKGSPAVGVIQDDDIITSLNGTAINDVAQLRSAVADNGTQRPAKVGIERAGKAQVVEVTPAAAGDAAVLGVNVHMKYTFPFEVQIQLDNVGGPSAGQMFALGIIDKLTPNELTGGEHIAGTGTIDSAGTIGAIGGIRQKLYGARDAGADWFLAPAVNCDEVVGHIPSGLHVLAVKTLDDSLTALEKISSGADTSALPSCTG